MIIYYSIRFLSDNSLCWRYFFFINSIRLMLYFINILLFLFSIWIILAFHLWLGLLLRSIWVFIHLCLGIELSNFSFPLEVFENIWWVINLWYRIHFSIADLIIFKLYIFLSIWWIFHLLQWRVIDHSSSNFFLLSFKLRNFLILNDMTIFDYSICIVTILSFFSLFWAVGNWWGDRLVENDWS